MSAGGHRPSAAVEVRPAGVASDTAGTATPRRALAWMAAAGVAALVATFAALRAPGWLPVGSDNDEYLLVAEQLAALRPPVVAGVEATKYPLGYPLLLAVFGAVGLPVATAAVALNLAAVAVTAGFAAATVRRLGVVAALAAAGYVAANAGVWSSVYSVMPDVLFTAVVAAIVLVATGVSGRRDVAVLAALVAAAAALKTVGVAVGIGVGLGLLAVPRLRRVAWWPPAAGFALAAASAVAVAPYPQHTTGYARLFSLSNPYDLSSPRVGVVGVAGRVFSRADTWFADLGHALFHLDLPAPPAVVAGVTLLLLGIVGAGLAGRRTAAWVAGGVAAVYSAALLVWPFAGHRFGLPLVPLAAAGVGAAGAALARSGPRPVGAVLVAGVLALHGFFGATRAAADAAADAAVLGAAHRSLDALDAWADAHLRPGDVVASMDYREVSRRLDRPVVPVPYDSDPAALWAASGGRGADYLVVVHDLYPRRQVLAARLLAAFPDRFTHVHSAGGVDVHAVTDGAQR